VAARDLKDQQGRWVQIEGRVRIAETSTQRLSLLVRDGTNACRCFVLGETNRDDPKKWIGAKVRVRGICSNSPEKAIDRMLVPGLAGIEMTEKPQPEASAIPVTSIDALLNRELGDWTNSPVRVNGIVSSQQTGSNLVVRDVTGTIRADVCQLNEAPIAERVDVWGYLNASPSDLSLSDAYFESTHPAGPLPPKPLSWRPGNTNSESRLLTTAAEVFSLHADVAQKGLPVRIRGTITYADSSWGNGFVQDSTGSVYFHAPQTNLEAGQFVEITGKTRPGDFASTIADTTVKVLSRTNLPPAPTVELDDLGDGRFDTKLVRMEGVVRKVFLSGSHVYLTVSTRQGKFKLLIPNVDEKAASGFLDTQIVATGACGSDLNSRGQIAGVTLHVQSTNAIQVLGGSAKAGFDYPPTPISTISTFDPERLSGRRVKVSGTVTLCLPDQRFYLQDQTGGILVCLEQPATLRSGDQVEVLGFPAMGDFSPRLEEASFRKTGTTERPDGKRTTAEQILQRGSDDGKLVRLQARLLQDVPRSARPKLVLQDGPIIFTAHLASSEGTKVFPAYKAGSEIRVDGVCAIQGGDWRTAETFRLLLAEPEWAILQNVPSAWTSQHTIWVSAGLVAAGILAIAWIGSLRRQVGNQTEVIRQKLREVKEAADSLEREKQLLATLVDALPDNVFAKDKEGRYFLNNRAHAEFHGMSVHESLVGKKARDFMPPGSAEISEAADALILSGKRRSHQAERLRTNARGESRWLLTTKVPLLDAKGEVQGVIGISRDITESKKAESELAYERDLLRALLDHLPDALYFKDLDSRFVRVGRSKLESCFGLARAKFNREHPLTPMPAELESIEAFARELPGKGDFDFYEPARAEEAYADEQEIIRTGVPIIGKVERTPRLDGSVTWCISTKMPWRDNLGNIIGTFGISKDITSIKEAEVKLEQAHKELVAASRQAGMAEVATSVLHNVGNVLNSVNVSASVVAEKVQQSRLANLSRAVGLLREHQTDLAEYLVHDSKGRQLPDYLGQLADHLRKEQELILSELAALRKNIDHIGEIVSMQQSYAKVLGVTETIRPVDLVEDALNMNATALARHEIQVVRDYAPDLPHILIEKHKALQVLVNLIRNAKYACDESGSKAKQVILRVTNRESKIKISVIDNGVGIPPENLTRIFNHGFTTRKNGHGFGLHSGAIVAKEMGGALIAHSEGPGRGAAFTLELPLQPASTHT
jgi:PAS domain S-box-containing protein